MADTIRLVEYFYITAPNKAGEGARALNTLKEAGVNLLAFSGFPQGRRAQMDFVPANPAAFKQAATKAEWKRSGRGAWCSCHSHSRPGSRVRISWSSQPFPSGSSNEAKEK
jgi:hypothetical protein